MSVVILLRYLAILGLKNNLVIQNGSGSLIFQREKQYMSFRYISNLCLIIGVALTATIYYFLYKFVYSKFNAGYMAETINIVVAGSYNIMVSKFLKKRPSFNNYLYENSYSFAYDTVFITSVMFVLRDDLNGITPIKLDILPFFSALVMALIVIFITNVIIGFFVKSMNRDFVNISARNIAVRLFMMAIFSILVYYAQMLV